MPFMEKTKNTIKDIEKNLEDKRELVISNLKKEIKKLEDNKQSFIFFVMDTKGQPNSTLSYIYETALALKNMGVNVKMIHGEEEFIGVEGWLGEEYAKLPHFNIEKDGVAISPSDFLFIPEAFSNVMYKTFEKKLPCKRIVMLTNYTYMTEIIQPGVTWGDYGINECICATDSLNARVKNVFPFVNTHTVYPMISDVFNPSGANKKPFINIVAKNKSDVNKVVKTFFWKYPMFKWVGFRDLRGMARADFADALDEAFATVWIDEKCDIGYSALEAMKKGSIIIGRVPDDTLDWMCNENPETKNPVIADNGVWFYNANELPEIIASVVQSYLHDNIPELLYQEMNKTVEKYSPENFKENVKKLYLDTLVKNRKEEMEKALSLLINNNIKA
jgi:hypothetical protein